MLCLYVYMSLFCFIRRRTVGDGIRGLYSREGDEGFYTLYTEYILSSAAVIVLQLYCN